MQICVGVGHGRVVSFEDEDDYWVLEVNITSKLGEDTAGPGETLFTDSAFLALTDSEKTLFGQPNDLEICGSIYIYYRYPETA